MSQRMGYWVDLAACQFDDTTRTGTIMGMTLGEYEHPLYGTISLTPERIQRFADNVNSGVRGTDLDIDYDHKQYGGKAAGWVRKASASDNGLALTIEWTPEAYAAIKAREYRYFSPEFADEWTHPKTQTTFKDVLFGGGLTNRPFLKDILPINMSETFAFDDKNPAPPRKDEDMDLSEIRKALGLSDTASEEDVLKAAVGKLGEFGTMATQLKELQDQLNPPPPPAPVIDPKGKSIEQLLAEIGNTPDNPAVKNLTDLVKAQHEQLAELNKGKREAEVNRKLDALEEKAKAKKFAIPPVVRENLFSVMTNEATDPKMANEVYDAYERTLELGLVDMSEHGWQRRNADSTPYERLMAEAASAVKANPTLDMSDAMAIVAARNPELYDEYRKGTYITNVQ